MTNPDGFIINLWGNPYVIVKTKEQANIVAKGLAEEEHSDVEDCIGIMPFYFGQNLD